MAFWATGPAPLELTRVRWVAAGIMSVVMGSCQQIKAGLAKGSRRNNREDRMSILARVIVPAGVALAVFVIPAVRAQSADMTFFVTSSGPGKGADLGGLDGADAQCQKLAQAGGAGTKTWHAYLSTQAADGKPAVNARDRIGRGPWQNAKGVVIAKDVAELHSANKVNKDNSLTEKGEIVNGYGDQPNRHDILTGSQPDGTAFVGSDDRTCKNWTSSTQGAAMLGHSDINGPATNPTVKSWNSAHPSRGPEGGCSQADLKSTGGDGLLYCFAVN
jgi:hypothetical protein